MAWLTDKNEKGITIMKKLFILCLLTAIAASCFICASACGEKTETVHDFSEVVFENATVDVRDQPDYFAKVYGFGVEKVTLDGEELDKSDYAVKNGYFAFAYCNYKLMGLGTHDVKVFFAEGERAFSFTVTDVKAADFSLKYELPDGGQIGAYNLPKAVRNNEFQEYALDYELRRNSEILEMRDDGDEFYYAFYETGEYDLVVKVDKDQTVTEYKYPFTITDKYGFSSKTDYAAKDAYQAFNGKYSEEKGCIVGNSGGYLTIDGGLVARAKYSGYDYLFMVVGSDYDNDCYVSLQYNYGNIDFSSASSEGEFYSHSGKQAILLSFANVNKEKTSHSLFNSSFPVNVYSAKFVNQPVTDMENYACHAYGRRSELWAQSNNGGWDYTGDDIMELHTDRTICFSTEKIKQALALGYTKVILDAKNSDTDAKLYYDKKATDFTGSYGESNSDSAVSFSGGSASAVIDITGLADSSEKWTYLAGVTQGKLVITSLTFTASEVADVTIYYNGTEQNNVSLRYGKDALDLTSFDYSSSIDGLNAVWTMDDAPINMDNAAYLPEEGSHSLKVTLKGDGAIGKAVFTVTVYKELSFDDYRGELVSADRVNIWKANYDFKLTSDGFSAGGSILLKTAVIAAAQQAGYNYLEVTANAVDGWIISSLNTGEFSTYDNAATFILDISGVTPDAGYTQILYVNQYSLKLNSAKFVQSDISEDVNYAHFFYKNSDIWAATDGLGWASAYPNYTELDEMGYPCSAASSANSWKTFYTTNGTPCLRKAFLEKAVAEGYKNITLTLIGLQGAEKLYYFDKVSAREVTYGLNPAALSSGVNSADFIDGRVTVTLDISSVSEINGEWAYLAGITNGTLLIETATFGK